MRQRHPSPIRSSLHASYALRGQLAALSEMISCQQSRITEQDEQIKQQREELVSQREQITRQERDVTRLQEAVAVQKLREQPLHVSALPGKSTRHARMTSRRALLRLGGAGAAVGAIVIAGGFTEGAQAARAAGGAGDDTAVIQGTANINTSQTGTILNAAASSGPAALLSSDNSGSSSTDATQTSGVTGIGPVNTNGIIGIGNGAGGFGVWGQSDAGYGIVGESSTGIDLGVFGTGRFQQRLQVSVGAPTSGSYLIGEQVRDSNGDLYICVQGGNPGAWKKVAAIPSGTVGGAAVFFSAPFRVFDTRGGVGALGGGGNMSPGQIIPVQVTGTANPKVPANVVPAGAVGIIGNLLAIGPTGTGFLGIQPSTGAGDPYAWVNYVAGPTIDNAVIVGLSAGGAVDIQCNQAASGAGLTITGYII